MYAHPPYWEITGYGLEFGWEQYLKIAELMKSCKSKIMLSINDHLDNLNAFTDLNISTTKISYTVCHSGAGQEQK
ncbi:hypothetical protein ASC84_19990 [Acinetobacter sp. Root1280]|uniref:hypothetical protein n=1 Tax=Acinetobacter sp. Root1280 TaxID=1736444 RepID=UPI0006F3B5E7|nr:hypothetical protein [Acinetobacter sp. Root1280]KQW99773.1 hypothetical protein ASC84_19990 [Acinetobacter sp. Root1280]